MRNRKAIREEIELVSTLKVISQAYEEISVMRMQKIRDSVLRIRDYLSKLSGVYTDVKNSHKRFLDIFTEDEELDELSPYNLLPQNGKKLVVFLAANERMNGEIISRVFHTFEKYIKTHEEEDILIIGKIGKELYTQYGHKREYTYMQIPDDKVKIEDLKQVVSHFLKYQEINIFYGKFHSIVNQEAFVSNISGEKLFDNSQFEPKPEDHDGVERKFIYEPSLPEIYNFFETQIFSALFKQTIEESHLSRYASRIKAMEEALQNIEAKSKNLYSEERRVKKSIQNKKQNGAIAGIALWSK